MTPLKRLRIITWTVSGLLVVAVALVLYWGDGRALPVSARVTVSRPFTLVDQRGATVTEAPLKGHPSALFFGYTYCPDVCPTTLSDLTGWLQKLGRNGDKLKVYFVTVDPERDTREQLAAYLQAFDPRIIGLTGTRAAIDQILKEYGVYSRKVPLDGGGYSMDHSAAIYLLDRDAMLSGTVDYTEAPDKALAKLTSLVAAD